MSSAAATALAPLFGGDVGAPLLKGLGLISVAVVLHVQARRCRFEFRNFQSFLLWIAIGGLLGGHFAHELLYARTQIFEVLDGHWYWSDPLALLRVWRGWRSIGGFWGVTLAALLWHSFEFKSTLWLKISNEFEIEGHWFVRRARPEPVLEFGDAVVSAFPLGWAFRELALGLTHERLGMRAAPDGLAATLAPGLLAADGSQAFRYDLGLIESLITLLLGAAFIVWLTCKPKTGNRVVFWILSYSIARFAIEFLQRTRGPTPQYLMLTPAQWGCAALIVFAVGLAHFIERSRPCAARSTESD